MEIGPWLGVGKSVSSSQELAAPSPGTGVPSSPGWGQGPASCLLRATPSVPMDARAPSIPAPDFEAPHPPCTVVPSAICPWPPPSVPTGSSPHSPSWLLPHEPSAWAGPSLCPVIPDHAPRPLALKVTILEEKLWQLREESGFSDCYPCEARVRQGAGFSKLLPPGVGQGGRPAGARPSVGLTCLPSLPSSASLLGIYYVQTLFWMLRTQGGPDRQDPPPPELQMLVGKIRHKQCANSQNPDVRIA